MMKKRAYYAIFLFLFLLLCGISQQQQVYAEEGTQETYIQSLSAVSLSGVQSINYQYFQIEDYWNVDQVTINLEYDFSSLVIEEKSSLTLFMNGTPFHSFRINKEHTDNISVVVPRELLIDGVNTLMLDGRRTTDEEEQLYNVCKTEDYNDNWLTLKETSHIAISYHDQPMDNSINTFFSRFVGLDTVKSSDHVITVGGSSSAAELESAIYSFAGFGKAKDDGNQQIPLLKQNDAQAAAKSYRVHISKYDALSDEIKSKLGTVDVEKRALMKLITLKGQSVLVVTSNQDDLLVKAGRYIANQELMEQTASNEKWIDANTDVLSPSVTVSRMIKLTETGDKVLGPMHREKSYFISLPANQSIAEASKIRLDMRYAQNLDFNRSLVTVLINNKPIGSKKLSDVAANSDVLELSIPKNLDVNGNFTVTVAFDLEISSLICTVEQDQMPWAYIDSSSILQLNTVDRHDLLFNYYPSNFMRNGSFNSIAVVLPAELSNNDYASVANIFHLLGRYAQTNHGEVNVYFDDVDVSLLQNKQIIVIGSYKNNKLIRHLNDYLYFKYSLDGEGFVSNEKKSIELEYGKTIGSLQLISSPYSENYGMLIISGAQPQSYELASQLLVSESKLWQLYGDGMIVDKNGQVSAFRYKELASQSSPVVNILERKDVMTFVVSAMLTLTLAIVALLLLTRKYWRKRRKNNETISKQLHF